MSLMKLFAVGQSIIGIKDEPSRYKMTTQNLLPKFAPAQRPISLAPTAKVADLPVKSPAKLSKVENAREVAKAKSISSPPAIPIPASIKVSATPKKGHRSLFKHNPFTSRTATKVNRPPVQAELSLDAVKVMRNDLSDADLEIVPVRGPARPDREAQQDEARQSAKAGELTDVLWGRLTERWFNANRARV